MRSKYRRGLDMVDKLRRFTGIGLLLLVVAAFVLAPGASATPSYASKTGKSCGTCHVDPNGGGTLTSFGKAFKANGHKIPTSTPTTPPTVKPKVPKTPTNAPPVVEPKVPKTPKITKHLKHGHKHSTHEHESNDEEENNGEDKNEVEDGED